MDEEREEYPGRTEKDLPAWFRHVPAYNREAIIGAYHSFRGLGYCHADARLWIKDYFYHVFTTDREAYVWHIEAVDDLTDGFAGEEQEDEVPPSGEITGEQSCN